MSEFIELTPLQAAQEAQVSASLACEAAAEARVGAQEAREYINSRATPAHETEVEEITWTIDRTGDRNMLNLINLNSYDIKKIKKFKYRR